MLSLDKLPSLVKKRKRIGRGGSKGGTCGKGHKGQKARTGGASKVRSTFEGGQTPLVRRLPKRGFNNSLFTNPVAIVNLDSLERVFDSGVIVDDKALLLQGLIKAKDSIIKVLGRGTLSKKLTIHAHAFSKTAQEAIEKAGGSCVISEEMQ